MSTAFASWSRAQYAALGIVDERRPITQFITSGISSEQRSAIGDLPRGHGLLGLIIRENRSYRIPKISAHPESYGFPANHPPMDSFLGVPVTVRGQRRRAPVPDQQAGCCRVRRGRPGAGRDVRPHAGHSDENVRLHEQVQRLEVVDERCRNTRELHDSVIQMIYAVTLSLDDVPDLVKEAPAEAALRLTKPSTRCMT